MKATTLESGGKPVQFDLDFRPNAELVPVVRQFVSNFYDEFLGDSDAASRVALATHELLENAVKYSADGRTALNISVAHHEGDRTVVIRISNQASPENLETVRGFFKEVDEEPDAFMHYQSVIKRSAKKKEGSGLGLVRVRAEGEMSMRGVIQGNEVCILAETKIGRSGA